MGTSGRVELLVIARFDQRRNELQGEESSSRGRETSKVSFMGSRLPEEEEEEEEEHDDDESTTGRRCKFIASKVVINAK